MASRATTVKLSPHAHVTLMKLAADQRRSMTDVVAFLIEQERRAFLDGANADYARLRADPDAWNDDRAEIASMDGTLMDGLGADPCIEQLPFSSRVMSGMHTSIRCEVASKRGIARR